ncbi:glycosyltransferase family 4 protein [Brevibacillus sp. TJ4]|uniref:glycosyltransferase family 4 protein n=1 Tax=Brevibacillus sp. TJ4 TaxID=3234853 RepID=UPI0037D155F4
MNQRTKRPRVAIVYKSLPQYRRRFYELLKERLEEQEIEFLLIYGQPGQTEASKRDSIELPWAHKIQNRLFRLGRRELYWQPCTKLLKDTDLVIVEQASKLLLNYWLMLQQSVGIRKLAFWGHGINFQTHRASWIGERLKSWMSRHVHWWFAYNQRSAQVVKELGFPEERICDVQNAIDTRQLVEERAKWDEERLRQFAQSLGIKSQHACLFTGAMYPEKRIPFLLEACQRIRESVPDFQMIFIGAGEDEGLVKEAAARHDWIHYAGPKFDTEKVPYYLISKLFLMPGLVGLAVLDTFALGVPLVTTRLPYHSPEIAYLRNQENGVMLEDAEDSAAYAEQVVRLLTDAEALDSLQAGCRRASLTYTVEEMADRFAHGICRALRAAEWDMAPTEGGKGVWQS